MFKFMLSQKRRIEYEKWLEGCRLKRDPGSEYILNWISLNGAFFRKAWEDSLCKDCALWENCGYLARSSCEDHIKNEPIVKRDFHNEAKFKGKSI